MSVQRINVVGTTGSGKSTMAARLAQELSIPHVELDAISWGPNWQSRPHEEFRAAVIEATRGDAWVVDGNYSTVRDIIWSRLDMVVWLDYPLPLILWRLLTRTVGRWWRRELLWNTNRERLLIHFTSRQSLFWWAIKTYKRRKKQYSELWKDPQYAHLTFVHLRSPREAEVWLAQREFDK